MTQEPPPCKAIHIFPRPQPTQWADSIDDEPDQPQAQLPPTTTELSLSWQLLVNEAMSSTSDGLVDEVLNRVNLWTPQRNLI